MEKLRIPLRDSAAASGDAARALASPVGHMALFRLLAHADTNVLAIMRLGGAILRDQRLDARARELAILVALRVAGGHYEWPQHVQIASDLGVGAAQIAAIERLDFSAEFDARDRDLLAFAHASAKNGIIGDALFDAVRSRLSDREIVELLIAIGFYTMLAKITDAVGLAPEAPQGRSVIRSLDRHPPSGPR